jgi:hypothetical protein
VNVVAHQVDLVVRVPIGGVGRHLGRRAGEYQPSPTGIHGLEAQRVLQERPRRNGVVREQNRMEADDHLDGKRTDTGLLR